MKQVLSKSYILDTDLKFWLKSDAGVNLKLKFIFLIFQPQTLKQKEKFPINEKKNLKD